MDVKQFLIFLYLLYCGIIKIRLLKILQVRGGGGLFCVLSNTSKRKMTLCPFLNRGG